MVRHTGGDEDVKEIGGIGNQKASKFTKAKRTMDFTKMRNGNMVINGAVIRPFDKEL